MLTNIINQIQQEREQDRNVSKQIGTNQRHILHLCTFKTPTFTCATNNSLIFLFYLTFS